MIASVAFGPRPARWVGLGIGIAGCTAAISFVGMLVNERRSSGHLELRAFGRRIGVWSLIAATMALVAAFEVVQTAVLAPGVARWLTLANGLIIAVLACAGLVTHELSSERVVHVLEIVERPPTPS